MSPLFIVFLFFVPLISFIQNDLHVYLISGIPIAASSGVGKRKAHGIVCGFVRETIFFEVLRKEGFPKVYHGPELGPVHDTTLRVSTQFPPASVGARSAGREVQKADGKSI
jgi:hypothetical protein